MMILVGGVMLVLLLLVLLVRMRRNLVRVGEVAGVSRRRMICLVMCGVRLQALEVAWADKS